MYNRNIMFVYKKGSQHNYVFFVVESFAYLVPHNFYALAPEPLNILNILFEGPLSSELLLRSASIWVMKT